MSVGGGVGVAGGAAGVVRCGIVVGIQSCWGGMMSEGTKGTMDVLGSIINSRQLLGREDCLGQATLFDHF